jgi:DNA replication protein DnaC
MGQFHGRSGSKRWHNWFNPMAVIKQATFDEPTAAIEDIEYHPDRNLDKNLILELATGNYIQNQLNIILMGALGSGKTWISNACDRQVKRVLTHFSIAVTIWCSCVSSVLQSKVY